MNLKVPRCPCIAPFTVVTDLQTLVWLLNQPPNDLPNAMMARWLAYARLFDFDVKHIKGNKNSVADGLSRRGKDPRDESDSEPDDYFELQLYNIRMEGSKLEHSLAARHQVFRIAFDPEKYTDNDDIMLGKYLQTLQRPDGMTDSQYQQLRGKARNFLIRDELLFKRGRRTGIPPCRVVGLPDERVQIIKEMHDEIGHLGQKATYNQIAQRYQWKGMYNDVVEWVKTCDECQKRAKRRFAEPLHPTWSITV